MAPGAREIIEGLREEIRRIERRPARRPLASSSGDERVDALLPGGGFPRGALSELAGAPGSGKTALALSALAAAAGDEGLVAYLDGRGELYPPAAAALGLDLERLLIVRPPEGGDARATLRATLWAAEALLASGAFEGVALDVPLGAAVAGSSAADAMLRRVRAAAEQGGAVALWLGGDERVRIPAAVHLEVARDGDGARVRCARARADVPTPLAEPLSRGGTSHAA